MYYLEYTFMELKIKSYLLYFFVYLTLIIFLVECLLYFTGNPSQTSKISHRYDFLDDIGIIPKKNVTMKHSARGFPSNFYSINKDRYRGKLISNENNLKKIIVLGDSHSFGIGVNDHETYPYKLDYLLEDFEVMNLSSPGWGLTHQINRYLTLAESFDAEIIIIQFCSNDPGDSEREKSVIWDNVNSKFLKVKINNSDYNSIKKLIAKVPFLFDFLEANSLIYKKLKHIYAIYLLDKNKKIAANFTGSNEIDLELQKKYILLLDNFIKKLNREDKKVIFIDVASQLKSFNNEIYNYVIHQDKNDKVKYLNVAEWIPEKLHKENNLGPIYSHYWGNYSNKWIALNISRFIVEDHLNKKINWFENIKKLDLIDNCFKYNCKKIIY